MYPKGFIFGAASSSYQIEGAWDIDGKGTSIWDDFCHEKGNVIGDETGDVACNSYNMLDDDIQLAIDMGLSAYRFSVSWPRILPNGTGEVNPLGFKYYDALVDKLLANNIKPFLTLFHWDLPSPLEQNGGWLNRQTADAFENYAKVVAEHFDGRVFDYITLNEPQCSAMLGYGNGIHAPGYKLPIPKIQQCFHNLFLAHGKSVRKIREASSNKVNIGLASTGNLCYPQTDNRKNREAARIASFKVEVTEDLAGWGFSHSYVLDPVILGEYPTDVSSELVPFINSVSKEDMEIMSPPVDFVGANIYNGREVDTQGNGVKKYHGFPRTAVKWPVTPESLRYGCVFLAERYNLPVYVTENGQACNDRIFLDGEVHDADRIDFMHRYLIEMKKAIDIDGIDVRGYFHWSLLDNFEWNLGYNERFGLVFVDYPTCKRIMKDSAKWYAAYIKDNTK